jgi:hypothetical protein
MLQATCPYKILLDKNALILYFISKAHFRIGFSIFHLFFAFE